MNIGDLEIRSAYCVFDVSTLNFIFQWLDVSSPGDIPPDIACMPVVGLRSVGNVLYIDTCTGGPDPFLY